MGHTTIEHTSSDWIANRVLEWPVNGKETQMLTLVKGSIDTGEEKMLLDFALGIRGLTELQAL